MLPLLLFSLLFIASLGADVTIVGAETTPPDPVGIRVDRRIQIQNGGSVIISDTISLSTQINETVKPLQNFSLGFPYEYSSNLAYCFAYDASNPDARLEVAMDVGLGRVGFYGVSVAFPSPVNIGDGGSYNFTVVFVISELVFQPPSELLFPPLFNLTRFPIYPSLTQDALVCNVTVVLPPNAEYKESSHEFNTTIVSLSQILNHTKAPLESYAREYAWLAFDGKGAFLLIDSSEVRRDLTLDEMGGFHVSDTYHIINKATEALSNIKIGLPQGAYDVSARDAMGSLEEPEVEPEKKNVTAYTNATVAFRNSLKTGEAAEFTVDYRLPWERYVNQQGFQNFNLNFTFLERFDWIVRKLTVSITLPNGAQFVPELSSTDPDVVNKGAFREELIFSLYNVTQFHDLSFSVSYRYLVFWASFYPMLFAGIFIIALFGITFLWRAPRPSVPVIPVSMDALKGFVDAYEERSRILQELENMERQARKGRIPRRRYKVRRRTLEGRLSTLSRDITDLRGEMQKAGPKYADIMRRIEIAETELAGLEDMIRGISLRRRRGELSSGAYRRLLEEYHRKRERAKTTIDGLLLRLKEEIR